MTLSPCGAVPGQDATHRARENEHGDKTVLVLEAQGLRLLLPRAHEKALLPLTLTIRRGALKALLPPCPQAPRAPREVGVWLAPKTS